MTDPGEELLRQRETLFSRLVSAYLDRDLVTIEEALRPDVVLHLPGSSPFAGEHHGRDAVGRFLLGLRQFLESHDVPTAFEHDENPDDREARDHRPWAEAPRRDAREGHGGVR